MFPVFYLDASTLAKRYKTEPGTNIIDDLFHFSKTHQEKLYTARHTIVEVGSVIMRLKREKILSLNEAHLIIQTFIQESQSHLNFVHITPKIELLAIDLMSNYSLKAADAVHVSVIIDLYSIFRSDLYVVCSDKQMCNALRTEQVNIVDPNDETSFQKILSKL
jgi:predicted nucleic acid-binding protein